MVRARTSNIPDLSAASSTVTNGAPENHAGSADSLPDILRAGFEWLPIGVVMVDADGAIVLVNRALERLLGYTAPELIGQSIDIVVPETIRTALGDLRNGFTHAPRALEPGRELFARRKDGSEVPVEVGLSPIPLSGRRLVLASVFDITERRVLQADLRRVLEERIDFEALVGELAAQFVNVQPEDVDRTIEEALARLVRTLNVDRSALFQVVEDTGDFVHTHQWTRPRWASPPPRISASEQFPWHLSQIRAGEIVCFTSVDEVPDEIDRDGLRRLGTRSGVTIPLAVGDQIWGAVTFATVAETRAWTPEIINRLRVVASSFANVLARKQHDETIRKAHAENARLRERLRDENLYLRRELNSVAGAPAIVGHSAAIRRVLEQVRQIAASESTVLLLGETGTGKTLFANRIHELSARRDRAMVRVNCASLSVASIEGELFGRERGSYTNGESRHVGLIELANGSTVFLDEVADLPPDTQASLARVLETQEVQPLGNARPVKVDLRVIAASRRDLVQGIQQGTFRDDLYYRLNVLAIHVPPLRERIEDIPLLVWRFVDEFAESYGKNIDTIDQESMDRLQTHTWPGNARELRNVVERAMIVATSRQLRIDLPPPGGKTAREPVSLRAMEKAHITATLAACDGKIEGRGGAAARLGLSPRALASRLTKLGIRHRRSQNR